MERPHDTSDEQQQPSGADQTFPGEVVFVPGGAANLGARQPLPNALESVDFLPNHTVVPPEPKAGRPTGEARAFSRGRPRIISRAEVDAIINIQPGLRPFEADNREKPPEALPGYTKQDTSSDTPQHPKHHRYDNRQAYGEALWR